MNFAVLLLGGVGTRTGLNIPKQFIKIKEYPLFYYPLKSLDDSKNIDKILLVADLNYASYIKTIIKKCNIKKVVSIVSCGENRMLSVRNALTTLKHKFSIKDDDICLIHDAARPLLDETTISNNVSLAISKKAVTTVLASEDTLCLSNDSQISSYLNRDLVFKILTPQTFEFKLLYDAHINSNKIYTDDSHIIYDLNVPVSVVLGNKKLFKVTTMEDLTLIRYYLSLENK